MHQLMQKLGLPHFEKNMIFFCVNKYIKSRAPISQLQLQVMNSSMIHMISFT
jgi:predicted O-linked N-acetylglucosamine transferase (SPINDLY family)